MTGASPIILEGLELDALTELVNIGVSRAAASLRTMVGEHVLLSVPSLEIVSRAKAAILICERETDCLVAVQQDFVGAFSGQALLIFPEANSLELVRAVSGGVMATEDMAAEDIAGIEDEALAETANVVLNQCLATLANMLKRALEMSIPRVVRGEAAKVFEVAAGNGPDSVVLFLYINFAINDRDIRGYIAMLMDLPSLVTLRSLIQDFIARVVGEDADYL